MDPRIESLVGAYRAEVTMKLNDKDLEDEHFWVLAKFVHDHFGNEVIRRKIDES